MPYVVYDFGVRGISGRMQGSGGTYAIFRGNGIIRQQGLVSNPATPDQTAIRALFTTATGRWSTVLSDTDREAWSAWAADHPVTNRVGRTISRTGLSAYVAFYTTGQLSTAAVPVTGPTLPRPPAPTGVSNLHLDGGDLIIEVDHSILVPAGNFLLARMTPAILSPAITPQTSAYRLIEGVNTGSGATLTASGSPYAFAAADVKYATAEDDRVGIAVSIVNAEGWESEILYEVLVQGPTIP